jgi:hypothetical protein
MKNLRPHGTRAAATRHRRAGEPLCSDCLWSERERYRVRDAAARAGETIAPLDDTLCGTADGMAEHVRTGTKPCWPCSRVDTLARRARVLEALGAA